MNAENILSLLVTEGLRAKALASGYEEHWKSVAKSYWAKRIENRLNMGAIFCKEGNAIEAKIYGEPVILVRLAFWFPEVQLGYRIRTAKGPWSKTIHYAGIEEVFPGLKS